MLEVTEKILASIHAMPMSYGEIGALPYLKTISEYGISYSIERLIKEDYIIEKIHKKSIDMVKQLELFIVAPRKVRNI